MARVARNTDFAYLPAVSDGENRIDVERMSRQELRVYLKRRLRQIDAKIMVLAGQLGHEPTMTHYPQTDWISRPRDEIEHALGLDYLLVTRNGIREILEVLECKRRRF